MDVGVNQSPTDNTRRVERKLEVLRLRGWSKKMISDGHA